MDGWTVLEIWRISLTQLAGAEPYLLDVYKLYIRSILEYCSVVWHSTLTVTQNKDIENIQKLCLKIIFGEDYSGYQHALKLTELDRLNDRRHERCLKFGLKSLLHPKHCALFPVNPQVLLDIPVR